MLDVERADELVNEASRRVRGLDRFSGSAPIGRAELATIVLQGLAELGAQADWTVKPTVTTSVLHLMDEDEQGRYAAFEASVRRAAEKAGLADGQVSLTGAISERDAIDIDPAPSGFSRTARSTRSSPMRIWQEARPRPSCISSTWRSSNGL